MSEATTFQELMARVRAGDEAAARELVRIYEPTIRRTIRIRLADPRLRRVLDSTDIAQSVLGSFFVRAALGQYDLDDPKQLLRLLVNMSRKKLIDRERHERAARRDFTRTQGAGVLEHELAARAETPSQEVAGAELLEEMRKRLTPDERRLAEMRAAGRDWAGIAAEEGDTPEALRKKLGRAVDRIAEELGLHGGDDA
jgi:RNA polymerase sigma-70 factor (ECF subfamily)